MSAKISRRTGFAPSNRSSIKAKAALFAAGLLALQSGKAMGTGQSGTWIDTTSGATWSNVNNWQSSTVASGVTTGISQTDGETGNVAIANFNTLTLGGAMTVHLDSSQAITVLNLGDTSGNGYGWTIDNNGSSGNILTLQGDTYHGSINGGASTMPQINVANGGNDTISAELVVGGNGYQNAEWGITGTGTLNLTNSADSWGSGFTMTGGNTSNSSVLTMNLNIGSGTSVGSTNTSADYYGFHAISIGTINSTDDCALNIITGTVNGSQLTIGSSGGGTDTITVGAGAALNIGGENGINFQNQSANGGSGTLNVAGNVSIQNNANMSAGGYYQHGLTINQTGGLFGFYSNSGTTLGGTGTWNNGGGTETLNLGGGTFSVPSITIGATGGGRGGGTTTINFQGGTLQMTAGSGNFANVGSGATFNANVYPGGGTLDPYGGTVTFNTPLVHAGSGTDGGITLNDSGATPGTLTLTGSNTYTGPTTIARGTLVLTSTTAISASSAINVGPNGNFNVSALASGFTTLSTQPLSGAGAITGMVTAPAGSITAGYHGVGGTLSISGPLTLSGAGTAFDLTATSSGANGQIAANGGLTISAPTTVDAVFSTLPISSQTYTLFTYTGAALTAGEESDLSLSLAGSAAGYNATQFALNFNTPGDVFLVYTPASGTSSNLTWASTSNHLWDVSTTANWNKATLGSGANAVFNQGDNVTFDDTGGVTTAITLNAAAEPGSVTDIANNNNFVITGSGKITGTTNLTMSGSATLTLGTANDFTGTTFLNSGTIIAVNTAGSATGATGVTVANGATLQVGDNATTGAGIIGGTITDNGSVVLNRPDSFTWSQADTGSGSLTQQGSGTSTLSVAQQYSGATNVNNGTLQYGVTNALPYYTNLTLSGTGTLNIAGLGQTFDNVVTSGANTTIALGGGNITFNTTSPDVIQGQITGTGGSSVYLTGTSNVTLSNSVSIGTLSLANSNADNVTLNIAPGANIAVTTLNIANSGNTNGGTGVINQTGGLITAGTVTLAAQSTVSNNAVAVYNLSGGALNVSTGLSTAQSQYSKATINISGTGAINMLGNSTLLFGNYYGEPTTVNQTGGTVGFASGSTGGLQINGEGTYTWNLSGGLLSLPQITWGGQAANNTYGVAHGVLNFNGGTFQTTASSSGFFPANVVTGGSTYAYWTTTVTTGGAIIDTAGNSVTFTNNMAHDTTLGSTPDGGLTLNDSAATPGTLTLAGANSYTGNTTITRGTLALGPAGSINSSPTIFVGANGNFNVSAQSGYSPAPGQVLSGVGTVTGLSAFSSGIITGGTNGSAGTLTFNTPLTLDGGTSLFDLAPTSAGPNDLLVANAGLNVSGGSVIDAVFATAPTNTQTYVLFNYSGTALSTTAKGLLTLSAIGSAGGVTTHNLSLTFTTGSTDQVLLTFTPGSGSAANLTWASLSSGAWDTSSTNWHNPSLSGSGANAQFFGGDNVTFDDTAGVQTAITLNIAATPGSVTISSNTNNFSFSGVGGISGTTGLNKTGTSTLTLGTDNGYSGATSLGGGLTIALNPSGYATGITSTTIASGATFNVGNGTTTGAGNATGAITNNGSLNLDRPDNFTFPASVSGNAFVQVGAGITTLTGQSTYSGATNIQAGGIQLGVSNALPTGTNVNFSNVAGTSFGLASYSQTIGDLNGGANSTLNLGSGQLTIAGQDNMAFAGPVIGAATSSLTMSVGTGNNGGGTLTLSNNLSTGTLSVAPGDGDSETLNINSGNVTATTLNVSNGNGTGGTGTINQNGGTVTTANLTLANNSSIPGNANATYALNGGALNVSSGILMSNNNNTISALTIGPGATLNMLGNSSIVLGNYYGQPATITQTGGLVAFANGSTGGLEINGGGLYSYTLSGGELSIPSITWGGQAADSIYGGATASFEFNGGTLQITAPGQFFPGSVSISGAHWVTTIGAGATVDTDGNNVIFTNSLSTDPSVSTDGGLTKIGAGTLTLAGSDTYNGPTNVSAGTLAIATSASYAPGSALTVASGAQFILTNHGANATSVAVLGGLTNNGTIDITDNAMDVQNGSIGAITAQVKAAYHNGTWTGTSASGIITSSTATADTTHLTAVGVATGLTSFEGNTVNATDVLVKYTYYGDANLDGKVDASDYSLIDNGYLNHLTGWYNGDFNYDGVINGSDYTLIDNAFNMQGPDIAAEIAAPTAQIADGSASSAVPEPATLGFLGIGAVTLLGRRRRH